MDHSEQMRDQNIGKLLGKFSLPAIIGMLVGALYNVVDRIFVGHGVGTIGIAATTVAFPLMMIFMAVSMLIGVGSTALISIRLGERNREGAEKVAGNGMILLMVFPAIISAIYFIFPKPILLAFGADSTVFPYARDYMHIIMMGTIAGSLSMGMNNFIRAEGNPMMAMYTQILGAIVNAILNYIFIFKLGLGIKGSALSTDLAWLFSAMWVLAYFFFSRSTVKLRLKNFKLQLPVIGSIMAIGFAPFAMQVANSIQQLLLNKTLLHLGGNLALSAVGIIMSLSTLMMMPIIGLSQGTQPIVGYNYGAHQIGRVKETLKKAIISGTGIALAGYLITRIWPTQLVGLFSNNDVKLTQLSSHALLVFFAALPVIGLQIITSAGYFQAVGKALQASILGLSRQILFFIPLLLILPHFWGIEGVWRTAPIADCSSALLTATLLYFDMKKLGRDENTKASKSSELSDLNNHNVRNHACG